MARLDHDREQCARMLMKGMSPIEISERLGKPLPAIEAMLKEKAVIARHKEVLQEKLENGLFDDATVFTKDELDAQVDKLTKPALRALMEVMEDPKASPAAKVKAAELSLGWQKTMHDRTKAADTDDTRMLQPIVFDKKAVEALDRLSDELGGDDWEEKLLAEINKMPESRL